jgi:hypothetical protein
MSLGKTAYWTTQMNKKCEVIGWVHVDSERAQVLIRDANGDVSAQTTGPESAFAQYAIQTGSFRRGNRILDPVTNEVVGYEMESLLGPIPC